MAKETRIYTHKLLGLAAFRRSNEYQNCLNETPWNGYLPKTCKYQRTFALGSWTGDLKNEVGIVFEFAVRDPLENYRDAKGFWWEGWELKRLDSAGAQLLDGHGQPLPDGADPVTLAWEVFHTKDFNQYDFGNPISISEAKALVPQIADA